MADRCTLIATNITNAIFQQRLGYRQNAFTAKLFASANTKLLDFFLE